MGMYLGQLPPAEIARLKAELAETIISNFCYPRFFDYRTNSLRMRPVDRTKRQEVWLYLSSVDFTAWNRVDVMSPDLQRHIERLFIQFVQRNRNYFGQQGRKRMPDVRTLITTSSTSVVQSLRNHVSGQRQGQEPAFGSPRLVTAWSTSGSGSQTELSWEQVSAMTMLLQQQLQDMRGEPKSSQDVRPSQASNTNVPPAKRNGRTATPPTPLEQKAAKQNKVADGSVPSQASQVSQVGKGTIPTQPGSTPRVAPSIPATPATPAATISQSPTNGNTTKQEPASSTPVGVKNGESSFASQNTLITPIAPATTTVQDTRTQTTSRQGNGAMPPPTPHTPPVVAIPTVSSQASAATNTPAQPVPPVQSQPSQPVQSVQARNGVQSPPVVSPMSAAPAVSPMPLNDAMLEPREGRDMHMMSVGDEDIVIFEQLRHQMILWLRVEAVHAGVEMTGQGPAQLLDQLRRQERFDETRLQVVSTLLNLANQVIKNKRVSVLDYKQALMFHLMHTRR